MNLIEKLQEIVGEKNVSTNLDDQKSYATDSSQLEGVTEAVVWPTEIEQIQKIIRLANVRNFNIVPRGAGTSLEGGTIPHNSIVLDLNKLNKILALYRNENYVIVQPGVTLKRLNNVLANYNLFFPIIPSSFKVCTIGGMVANNSFGNYSHQFGRTSNWIMELDIIDGSGKLLTLKDPTKIAGSEGTLAIIVGIKLKLIKPFENISSNLFSYDNATDMLKTLNELKQDDSILSIQYYNKTCSKLLKESETHKLLVEYSLELKGEPGNKQPIKNKLLTTLHKTKHHIIKTIIIPQNSIESFLKYSRRNKIAVFGNISKGIFQIYFTQLEKKLIDETMEYIKEIQGYPLNIGTTNKGYLPETKKQEMLRLKKIYDPSYILNKGKII